MAELILAMQAYRGLTTRDHDRATRGQFSIWRSQIENCWRPGTMIVNLRHGEYAEARQYRGDVRVDTNGRYHGRTAVVTGGASGMGRATVHRLVSEGLQTAIIVDRDAEGARRECGKIETAGARALYYECDLADAEAIRNMGRRAAEDIDRLDLLVNCAGIASSGGLFEQEFLHAWEPIMNIHLRACGLVTQVLLPFMKRSGGAVVNVASDGGLRGRRGIWIYDAAKAGIIQAGKSMACEFATYGVRVNAIAPGWVVTEFHFMRADDPEQRKKELQELDTDNCLMRRLGRPEEIAAAIAFLGSDDASYITGTCLCVDGGRVGLEIPRKV